MNPEHVRPRRYYAGQARTFPRLDPLALGAALPARGFSVDRLQSSAPQCAVVKVLAAFLVVYLVWGSTYFALARGVETIPPLVLGAIRYTIAGLVMVGIGFWRGAARPSWSHVGGAALIGFLYFLCGNGGVTWAEADGLGSGAAALLCATSPLLTAIIAALLPGQTRPGWRAGLGLLLGFAGVVVLVLPNAGDSVAVATGTQTLAVMFASFAWSFGAVIAPRLARPESISLWVGLQMLVGGAWMTAGAAVNGELHQFTPTAISAPSLVALIYLIVFGSLLTFSAFNYLLQVVGPTRTSTYAYVNPVVAMALGWAFGGEMIGKSAWLAMVLILVGVGVTQWDSMRVKDAPAPKGAVLASD